MKKGIITAPGKITVVKNGFSVNPLSPDDIKFLTLYWDRIVIPETNLIRVEYPYSKDLINCGIVTEIDAMPNVTTVTDGEEVPRRIINAQYEFFDLVHNHPDIDWSIHQTGSSVINKQDDPLTQTAHEQEIIKFTLRNCLPIPDENIPLCDILEFKERRADELSHLHVHMDTLYQEILSAGDTNLANKTALKDLKNNISDIRKVSLESFSLIKNMDISAQQIVPIMLAGYAGYQNFGDLGFIGGVGAALVCDTSLKMINDRTEDRKKFKYLSHASKDKIIGEI
jgi:hypothetical protein